MMMGEVDTEGYGDIHKIVLQGIMSAGFLDVKGVKKLYIGACKALDLNYEDPERPWMEAVQKIVGAINERIKNFDMAIRSATCELTGRKFYIFLVTVEKPIMKMQSLFSKSELELFQKVMTAVLRKYDHFAVPPTDCLNMAREIDSRNFSIELAEAFIQKMFMQQYLAKYEIEGQRKDYEITLGIRTIREFEPILRDVYDDVMTNCNLCKTIMLHGCRCPKCDVFVHRTCFDKYLKKGCKACPSCKAPWAEKSMVKRVRQAAATESPSGQGGSARGRRSAAHSDSQDNVQMPSLPPMLSPTRKSGGRGRGKSSSPSPQASPKKARKSQAAAGTARGRKRIIQQDDDSDSD